MENIIEKANELGLLIRKTNVFENFEHLSKKLDSDLISKSLLDEYTKYAEILHHRETSGDIIEDYEKEKLKNLSIQIKDNDFLLEFVTARDKYIDLLVSIQESIREKIE